MKINSLFKKKKKKDKKPLTNKEKIKIASIIVAFLATIMSLIFLFGIIFLMNLLKDKPEFALNKFDNSQSSKIYDKKDQLVTEVGLTIRENVDYGNFPNSLIDAFIATEDSRFFEHNGFDISRFTKALIDNVLGIFTRRGGNLSGGSTFTMQLVKNTYFTDDRAGILAARSGMDGIKRKFQEIALALQLEQNINKKSIMELYINKINFGANGRGIENAANYYFGKHAKELNLSESALLVGIINSPYYFNPFNYLDKATERRDIVLSLMYRHGYITKKEYNLASSIKVEDILHNPKSKENKGKGIPYQAYIDVVLKEVESLTGLSPYNNPMVIYTNLDTEVQKLMDKIQEEDTDGYVTFADDLEEIASIAIENNTGAIAAILGGRNYALGGSLLLNHATEQFKQPGSSIKTILEYPLAFEKLGWATSHVVMDKPIFYKGTNTLINNYDNNFRGQVTLKEAVSKSLNIPAILALEEVIEKTSVKDVVNYMNDIGYEQVNEENFNIQFAIGGAELEVSVLQQAGAQATIMNGGVYHKPHTVRKIEFLNGRENINPVYEGKRVLSTAASFLTTELLKHNLKYGDSFAYGDLNRSNETTLYAKSGTTDWGNEGTAYGIPVGASKDAWIICSNADYTVATWVGYERAIKDKNTWMSYDKMAANPFGKATKLILKKLYDVNGVKNEITKPSDVSSITHIIGTFPYAAPVQGMNEDFVTTGYISSKFANLVAAQQQKIEDLKTFDVKINGNGNASFSWATYPKKEQTEIAPAEMDISLRNGDNVIVQATGKRIFDYSWLFGPVQYKAKIYVNDQEKGQIISPNETFESSIPVVPGSKLKVCGFYGYKDKDINSHPICKEFQVQDQDVTIYYPNITNQKTLEEIKELFDNFAKTYGTNVKYNVTYGTKEKPVVNIEANGQFKQLGSSETVKSSTLFNTTYNINVTIKGNCQNGEVDPISGDCKVQN